MQNFDQLTFKTLLEQERYQEAQAYLDQFLAQDLSTTDKGEVVTETAMEYISLENEINKRYLEALDEIIQTIKEAKKLGKDYSDKIDISALRNKIQNL